MEKDLDFIDDLFDSPRDGTVRGDESGERGLQRSMESGIMDRHWVWLIDSPSFTKSICSDPHSFSSDGLNLASPDARDVSAEVGGGSGVSGGVCGGGAEDGAVDGSPAPGDDGGGRGPDRAVGVVFELPGP